MLWHIQQVAAEVGARSSPPTKIVRGGGTYASAPFGTDAGSILLRTAAAALMMMPRLNMLPQRLPAR